ncbi:MAG: glutathione peroxidase [Cytophagales bacterium]|nr:glutathione peroxidase [Armatimonadota bacterium]
MSKPLFITVSVALLAAAIASLATFIGADNTKAEAAPAAPSTPKSVHDFTVKTILGEPVKLNSYKGKVLLIVNTASLCGNTPQYASLETLHQKYKGQGLRVLAFPANNFGQQEPGSDQEIKEFCTTKYRTTFELFSKIEVKGPNQAPLYKYLTSKDTDPKFAGEVEWNFAKFLVGKDGKIINRFPAGTDPMTPEVEKTIAAALK